MLTLLFLIAVVFGSLIVLLWAGTFFFQGYIYTEPSPGIYWQAPAAALLLTFGYAIWLFSVAFTTGASKTNIPINVFWQFTPKEDMLDRPAETLWAIIQDPTKKDSPDKDGEKILYKSRTKFDGLKQVFWYEDSSGNQWRGQGVIALEIEVPDKNKADEKTFLRFDLTPSDVDEYRQFVSKDGWTIREYRTTGPEGKPVRFRFTRLLLNIFFNAAHLAAWFIGLCLLLRFQWAHALGFAIVMWLAMSVIALPMMLGYAAEVAETRQVRTAAILQTNPLGSGLAAS